MKKRNNERIEFFGLYSWLSIEKIKGLKRIFHSNGEYFDSMIFNSCSGNSEKIFISNSGGNKYFYIIFSDGILIEIYFILYFYLDFDLIIFEI